jgi:membrane associated rhomboid family serine protease
MLTLRGVLGSVALDVSQSPGILRQRAHLGGFITGLVVPLFLRPNAFAQYLTSVIQIMQIVSQIYDACHYKQNRILRKM